MAVNVTVRDLVNFPGGTPKTITVDIIQVVPAGGSPEGDEIWVTSSTTTATASGGAAIESIFRNEMLRGFIRSSGFVTGNFTLDVVDPRIKIAIDEEIVAGVTITLASGTNLLAADVAADIEAKIQAQASIGGGGAKVGNLSYLNAQVRFTTDNKFQIESGTVSDTFTGAGKSSVNVGTPDSGTDVRTNLGFDLSLSSETLAAREIVETDLAIAYTSGDLLEVTSTAGLDAGDCVLVTDGTDSQNVLVSGAGASAGLSASEIRFVTTSGVTTGLAKTYGIGTLVRKIHEVDVKEPVSATTTIDELYRFQIDSKVNQIDFSA